MLHQKRDRSAVLCRRPLNRASVEARRRSSMGSGSIGGVGGGSRKLGSGQQGSGTGGAPGKLKIDDVKGPPSKGRGEDAGETEDIGKPPKSDDTE